MGVESIRLDLVPDLRGVTLHPRVRTVSAFAVVLRDMGPLAAQGAGLGVHGAAPGVGATLQPRGAHDAGREHAAHEVQLYQLGLEADAARLHALGLHVYSGQLLVQDLLDALLQLLAGGGGDKDRASAGLYQVTLGPVQGRASAVSYLALALIANNS